MKVRIRNFQSIKDATIDIEGFTVITGPNNSGKTAALRAIRGLFTNAAPGPFIRTGEAYFTVDVTFDDAQTITWEKGWEKPERKGSSINRYIVNGKELNSVGRGVPPEVEAFLVRDIPVGSEKLWPQIARQFDGTLFLVDKPGSIVAEALSDVERVGRLSDALRLSESDKRSITNELKIRRDDLYVTRKALEKFKGLDEVLSRVDQTEASRKNLTQDHQRLESAAKLCNTLSVKRKDFGFFSGSEKVKIPDAESSRKVSERFAEAVRLAGKTLRAKNECGRYQGFHAKVPDIFQDSIKTDFLSTHSLSLKYQSCKTSASKLEGSLPELPDVSRCKRIQEGLSIYTNLSDRLIRFGGELSSLDRTLSEERRKLDTLNAELSTMLETRGQCPTCGSICESHA